MSYLSCYRALVEDDVDSGHLDGASVLVTGCLWAGAILIGLGVEVLATVGYSRPFALFPIVLGAVFFTVAWLAHAARARKRE
jgi:hypothetical protein